MIRINWNECGSAVGDVENTLWCGEYEDGASIIYCSINKIKSNKFKYGLGLDYKFYTGTLPAAKRGCLELIKKQQQKGE